MTHVVITGKTLSGKSAFAKELVGVYKAQGVESLVFDPMNDPEWGEAGAAFVTDNSEEFLAKVWASRGCAVFIDEASENAGQHDTEYFKLATKGRHWGHKVHFLIQRFGSLNTNIRSNLSEIICFNISSKDGKLANEYFEYPEIVNAYKLKKGHYVWAQSMGGAKTGKMRWADD